ncbi:hypothetical protein DNTS_005579 [Danionella cerebrum]|uniref:Leprecan-like alpha-helical domain-containing protein n=1 Tax=Danionella cerebrum TaxID=2873325 RepID=A0A553NJZ3_9TELE|nr:hypothetical protein DNTS_005579 [Danionella translucida]
MGVRRWAWLKENGRAKMTSNYVQDGKSANLPHEKVLTMKRNMGVLLFFFASANIFFSVHAQYETYSFENFHMNDLMPLDSAYEQALDSYAAQDWKQSGRYLELSLRLHRLLRDSEAQCIHKCSVLNRQHEENSTEITLLVMGHIIKRAICLKECKKQHPVFSKSYPKRETLAAFEQRVPYRYLQSVYHQMNELEKAVSAAHTYLQRNPGDPVLTRSLDYYKNLFDIEEHVIDHEEKPYEGLFLKAVKLYNSGDFSSSAQNMELAVAEYFKTYNKCLLSCEGPYDVKEFKDFYPALAELFYEVLNCKVSCEEKLVPNVGGFFVEKYVATMFHYLQFAYYKLNDVRSAAPCASSYMLFDDDQVMKQNIAYYRFYRQQWGLQDEDFEPRPDIVSLEEVSVSSNPPDEEFEGIGDYEESFLAEWWQEPKTKGDSGEPAE